MLKSRILKIGLVSVIFIFSLLMLKTISQYSTLETNVGFLRFKKNVIENQYWLLFFYIHIFSITLCLLAGFTQFSERLLNENRKLHRVIGKIYFYNILIINFPACFILALFSNGGIIGITGFLTQNFLWGYFTLFSVVSVRKRDIKNHKIFMIFSYAITTTAITFRIIKNIFYHDAIFSYQLFYGLNVWISLILNMSIAYIIAKKKSQYLPLKSNCTDKNKESNCDT